MLSSSASFVAFVGSRAWPGFPPVPRAAAAIVSSGWGVACGCCVGADAALLSGAALRPPLARRLSVWCAFAADGSGAVPGLSAPGAVSAAAAAGAVVLPWCGGSPAVPVRARLASRTRAMVSAPLCVGVVAFLAPASVGSVAACRLAAMRGLPVWAFTPSGAAPLPLFVGALAAGSWVPAPSVGPGVWAGAWVWVPAQLPAPAAPWVRVPWVRGRTR